MPSSFTVRIEAEVERAYGVVAKINFNPELSFLKEQIISINDKYVATDKVVKRANKIGATRKASNYNLSVWVEVETKDSREEITQCCQGKCKGKSAIAFFRTFAVLVPDNLECEVPIIFFGAPSHNHRGKKAKFILKMEIVDSISGITIAKSADCVIPYKQSSTKKRQRTKTEEESDPEAVSGSQGNSTPSSPLHYENNDAYSLSQKRFKSFQISNLLAPESKPTFLPYTQDQMYYADAIQPIQSLTGRPGEALRSNSFNSLPQYSYSSQDSSAVSFLELITNELYMNYMFSLPYERLQQVLDQPDNFL